MNPQAKTDGMKYIATGTKTVRDSKQMAVKMADSLATSSLVWLLVKRHKVALLATGNVLLVLNWVFPAWLTFVFSLFAK